jgi:hypothetical protein
MRAVFRCGLLLVLIAISPPARGDGPLRWKFAAGDKISYSIVQEMNISGTGEVAGELKNESRQQLDVTWEVDRVTSEGQATVRLRFNRIRSKMTLPVGGLEYDSDAKGPAMGMAAINAPLYQALIKVPVESTVTTAGRVTGVKLPEEVKSALRRMPTSAAFGDLSKPETFQTAFLAGFPILPPDESVSPGHQWPVKTTAELPPGGTQSVETNYHYEGMREVEGQSLAVIRPVRTINFGSAQALQRQVKEQSSEGQILFDASAGRLHSSTLKHTVTITVGAGETAQEQKIEQSIQVTLVQRAN